MEGALSLTDTFWYVPTAFLPARSAVNLSEPVIVTVQDQTVWRFTCYSGCYVSGDEYRFRMVLCADRRVGASRRVRAPQIFIARASDSSDSATQPMTIGTDTLRYEAGRPLFVTQMTAGTAGTSLTHWAHMLPVTPAYPEWHSLPGYPDTSIPSLTSLWTTIHQICPPGA